MHIGFLIICVLDDVLKDQFIPRDTNKQSQSQIICVFTVGKNDTQANTSI